MGRFGVRRLVVSTVSCVLSAIVFRNYLSIFLSRTPTITYPTARSTKGFCYFFYSQHLYLNCFIALSTTYMARTQLTTCSHVENAIHPSISTSKASNVKPVISGNMHPVRELVFSYMITCPTQAALGTAQSATVQIILSFLLKI